MALSMSDMYLNFDFVCSFLFENFPFIIPLQLNYYI